MNKLLQLVFGDWRNVLSVVVCTTLATGAAQALPQVGGWLLVPALLAAAWWQAGR